MRNLKKLLIAFAVIALAVGMLAVTSSAVNFTGDLATFNEYLVAADELDSATDKLSLMQKSTRVYLLNKPLDPTSDGFDEAMELYDKVNADIIYGYIEECKLQDNAGKKIMLNNLATYMNKVREVKYYYTPAVSGGEPVENKYGATVFYFNESETAKDAREALSTALLEYSSDVLLTALSDLADDSIDAVDAYIADYLAYVAAEGDAKDALLQKLTLNAATVITTNETFRKESSSLHIFIRDNVIEPDVMKPSAKNRYKTFMALLGTVEYLEFKSDIAAYFAYAYSPDDNGRHTNLNSAADRVNSLTKKYADTMDKTADDYSTVFGLVDAVAKDIEARNNEKKKEIEYSTPLSEYNLTAGQVLIDMEDGKYPYSIYHSNTTPTGAGNGTSVDVVKDDYSANKYVQFTLGKAAGEDGISASQSSAVAYVDMKLGDTSNGYIMEFDVMTKSDSFKKLQIHTAENATNGGGRVYLTFFTITEGVVSAGGKTAFAGAFTPGEWTHITFCYKPDDGQGNPVVTLYIDYEWIGYWWSAAAVNPYKLTVMRVTPGATYYNLCMDNFNFYQGTGYRDINKLSGLSEVELFKYYTGVFTDRNYTPQNRDYALNQADLLFETVKNDTEIKTGKLTVDLYSSQENAYVSRELTYPEILSEYLTNRKTYILDAAVADTMAELKASIGDIFTTAVTTKNVKSKTSEATTLSNFLTTNAAYILNEDPDVIEIKRELNRVKKDIARINNLMELLSCLEKFDRATTCASMTKRMNDVNVWYKTCELYDASVYELIKNDPAVVAYEEALSYNSDTKLLAHITAMQSKIDAQRLLENSQKIINCIEIITGIEGYAPTDAFLSQNEEYVEQYITSIRTVLKNGNYAADYAGVEAAIAEYELIYPYFYARMQIEHSAILREKLEIYAETDSFITRLGVCAFVENYLATNDVDYAHASIIPLIELYEVYTQEIASQEDNYNAAIEQNTYTFINLVKRMQATDSYKEQKALLSEAALALCLMNVSSQEAQSAIAIYDEYLAALELKEELCAEFVEEATKLKYTKTLKDTYAVLVAASSYLDVIDEDVRGVENALKTYNEKLAEYNSKTAPANSLIEETASVVVSVRSVSIHSAILEIIKAIFSK